MTIDTQLAEAGWLVQSREQMNLGAGLGVAVREVAIASGRVDYALFVGRDLCGVVEAKPKGMTPLWFLGRRARGQVRFARAWYREPWCPIPVHEPETGMGMCPIEVSIDCREQSAHG
jgi:hypothetical protein